MANSLTGRTLLINVEGILFQGQGGVWVQKVRLLRNAFNDAVYFTYWDENGTPDHTLLGKAATWSTLTLTMTGLLVAGSPAVNDICRIYNTSTGNNQFRFQCATAGDNNDAIFDALNAWHGTVTDESSKVYDMKIWTPKTAFTFHAGNKDEGEPGTDEIDFGYRGKWFPNLAVHTISTSAVCEIWIR